MNKPTLAGMVQLVGASSCKPKDGRLDPGQRAILNCRPAGTHQEATNQCFCLTSMFLSLSLSPSLPLSKINKHALGWELKKMNKPRLIDVNNLPYGYTVGDGWKRNMNPNMIPILNLHHPMWLPSHDFNHQGTSQECCPWHEETSTFSFSSLWYALTFSEGTNLVSFSGTHSIITFCLKTQSQKKNISSHTRTPCTDEVPRGLRPTWRSH